MSKVYEMIELSPSDAVTIRVPLYTLTFANVRCMYGGEEDTVTILLNKQTGKIKLGGRRTCGTP